MVRHLSIWLVSLLLMAAGITSLEAQTDRVSFAYEITKNGGNTLKLKLTSSVSGKNMWIGISLYPPKVKNTLEEGKHLAFPIKQGTFVKEITVEPEYLNGTFEAAIWLRRLEGKDCPENDPVCEKLGYRLDGMVAYLWAYLVAP
ncbi:MAG: hypothetical protein D6681_18905 [Calditrichaeota bacterium]|nr:MAG: hypothetical protein D6681_18905 [Calditrichota bacterium]